MISALAAVLFFVLFALQKRRASIYARNAMTVAVMFATASLMWCVDGVASVIGGESFFDLSREDLILGLIIVGCGCIVYAALMLKTAFMLAKPNSDQTEN